MRIDTQRALRESVRARLQAIEAHLDQLGAGSTGEEREWHRPEAWSVAQLFEHLTVTVRAYEPGMRAAIARERGRPAPPDDARWKPSMFGALLLRAMVSPRRVKTFRTFAPAPRPSPDALDACRAAHRLVRDLLDASASVDLERARLSSPLNRLLRLNLGDALLMHVAHAERHLAQGERTLAEARRELAATAPDLR